MLLLLPMTMTMAKMSWPPALHVVVVVAVVAAAAPPALFAPPGSANQSPVRGHHHLTTRRHLGESRSQPHLRGPPGVVPPWQA